MANSMFGYLSQFKNKFEKDKEELVKKLNAKAKVKKTAGKEAVDMIIRYAHYEVEIVRAVDDKRVIITPSKGTFEGGDNEKVVFITDLAGNTGYIKQEIERANNKG